jgi:hypothetical protein
MDLLTTYKHQSELHVTTALSLISTLYKSTQHPLSLFPSCCVFISRFLATTSNSGDSSASRAQVPSSQPPLQSSAELVAPLLFFTTPRRGQHPVFSGCMRNRCQGNVFTEPLPRNGPDTTATAIHATLLMGADSHIEGRTRTGDV